MEMPIAKIVEMMPFDERLELEKLARTLQENYPVDEDGTPNEWYEALVRGWWEEQQRQPDGWFRWWDE